jgi:hypothetical protein
MIGPAKRCGEQILLWQLSTARLECARRVIAKLTLQEVACYRYKDATKLMVQGGGVNHIVRKLDVCDL